MTDRRFTIIAALFSATVGALVMLHLRNEEQTALAAASASAPLPQTTRSIPDPAALLRAMKLITVEIETGVESSRENRSWRGDVLATVSAPARFYYGVDLEALTPHDLRRNPLSGTLTIRVPPPRRLAVEVNGADERFDVQVGGTRLRDIAGEYYLGLARLGLYNQARGMSLSRDDRARLHETTRDQIAQVIRAITGDQTRIIVEFTTDEGIVGAGEHP